MIALPHYEPCDVSSIDLSDPIDFSHPLAQGLKALWIGIPGWDGGNVWIDLVKGTRATYTQTSTQGWFPSTLPGHISEVASTGSSEWDCGTLGNYSFGGEVTTCAWLKPTSIGIAQYLMGNRSTSLGDWAMDSTRVIWNSASRLSCTSNPANGVWNFIAHSRSGSTGAWTAECWLGTLTSPVAANGSATGITSNPSSNNGNVLGLGSSLSWNGRCAMQAWYDRYVPANQLEWLRQISLAGFPGLCNHVSLNAVRKPAGGASTFTASAAVTVGAATCSGSGTFTKPTYTGAGAATVAPATAAGSAAFTKPSFTATAGVTVAPATCSASATFTKPTYAATAGVTIAPASCAGSAIFANAVFQASAAVSVAPATASGSATFTKPTYTGTAGATVAPATCAGVATFTKPTFAAAGAVTASPATCQGSAIFASAVFQAAAAVTVAGAQCSGVATFSATPFVGGSIPIDLPERSTSIDLPERFVCLDLVRP